MVLGNARLKSIRNVIKNYCVMTMEFKLAKEKDNTQFCPLQKIKIVKLKC